MYNNSIFILESCHYLIVDQTKRTVARVPTMMEPVGSVALAHQNILVNAVKWIGVIPTIV